MRDGMDENREIEAIARHLWGEEIERLKRISPEYEPDEMEVAYGWCEYSKVAELQHKLGFRVKDGKLVGLSIQ